MLFAGPSGSVYLDLSREAFWVRVCLSLSSPQCVSRENFMGTNLRCNVTLHISGLLCVVSLFRAV